MVGKLVAALVLLLSGCTGEDVQPSEPPMGSGVNTPRCPEPGPPAAPCADEPVELNHTATTGERLKLVPTVHAALPGWAADRQSKAVLAFMASCEQLKKHRDQDKLGASAWSGRARDWRKACLAASKLPAGDDQAARTFFETEFNAYEAHGDGGHRAKFSGYYVQPVRGSLVRSKRYRYPMLKRPADLIEVQTSDFLPDGRGRRIWGHIDPKTGTMKPYPLRKEIRRRPTAAGDVVMWVDDPVDQIFAEIQGSARATMPDGSEVWLAFDGKNGRRFRGVGGILRRMGELERGQGTMDGVRRWFETHPERIDEISDRNSAKVFFRISDRVGAIGTQKAVLTPRRSAAIDRAVIGFSTPLWVDAKAPKRNGRGTRPWQRLLIAQDTGGAILGPARADIYWGDDAEAGAIAGRMGGMGRMWLLLPTSIKVDD